MYIKIKKLKDTPHPHKANDSDACYDVYATSINDLGDGRIEYGLGIALQPTRLPFSSLGPIQLDFRARSSIHKTGLILSNCIGTGDEGYTGEYKAVFYNIIPSLPNYKVGDRILQMQCTESVDIKFIEVDEFEETARGDGGFGSTKGFADPDVTDEEVADLPE